MPFTITVQQDPDLLPFLVRFEKAKSVEVMDDGVLAVFENNPDNPVALFSKERWLSAVKSDADMETLNS